MPLSLWKLHFQWQILQICPLRLLFLASLYQIIDLSGAHVLKHKVFFIFINRLPRRSNITCYADRKLALLYEKYLKIALCFNKALPYVVVEKCFSRQTRNMQLLVWIFFEAETVSCDWHLFVTDILTLWGNLFFVKINISFLPRLNCISCCKTCRRFVLLTSWEISRNIVR